MTSRSFKPSSLSLRQGRPNLTRTSSASSAKSQDCSSPLSASSPAIDSSESVQENCGRSSTPDTQRIARSRPIAIELPPRRIGSQVHTPTPPEPLSARGDLLGGYFPLHEEGQRSYKPHPFHHDTSSGRGSNIASEPRSGSRSPLYKTHSHTMTDAPKMSENSRGPAAPDPLLMAMPLGKYHPSNYKNKSKTLEKLAPSAASASSQPQHSRKKSDVKKKLQQYQRDMVAQAAMAGRMPFPGARPISPKLLPLRSPGPVTPMELGESASYLAAGVKSGSSSSESA